MSNNSSNAVQIKNMVCPRCIDTVREIFASLNISTTKITLGEVFLSQSINSNQKNLLEQELKTKGFELIKDAKAKLISQIKTIVINQIHHSEEPIKVNFSELIATKLNTDYNSLSKLFSSKEGITIERFILKQKIEKVKELIFYNELTIAEIAYRMNYSSPAHLSSQFKKETGISPSQFKNSKKPDHKPLDSI